MTMVAVQVHGNNAAIGFANSQGHLQLNVYKPVIIHCFLQSVRLLTDAAHGFVDFMINGIELNRDRIDGYVRDSLMLVTAISPTIGYDKAAQVAHTAFEKSISLRQACLDLGYLSGEAFDRLVIPEKMTRPG